MLTFKQYYILENPQFWPNHHNQLQLDDPVNNMVVMNNYIPKAKRNFVLNRAGISYHVFVVNEDDEIIYIVTDKSKMLCYIRFSIHGNGIRNNIIWNSVNSNGLYRFILFNSLLKDYEFVESDNKLSAPGMKMWSKIMSDGIKNKNKITEINYSNNTEKVLQSNSDIINCLKNLSENERYRIYRS